MKKRQKLQQYIFAASVFSLQIPASATAQVQELNVQRDTVPTYLKVQNKRYCKQCSRRVERQCSRC